MIEQGPGTDFMRVVAAAGGAVVGLGLMPSWENMPRIRKVMTVFIGFTGAYFIVPAGAHYLWGANPSPEHVVSLTFMFAAGAHVFIPEMVKLLTKGVKRILGDKP